MKLYSWNKRRSLCFKNKFNKKNLEQKIKKKFKKENDGQNKTKTRISRKSSLLSKGQLRHKREVKGDLF